jgi:ATP/maltotriose-dependent transcriptional regulator MalT/DNA-binding SARP family transcriptional activator
MSEYPVQITKVQAPPLRDETLARDRLLEWLSVKIHRRAVLILAEAGYGKTTLLADFTRRTRVRVLWYRLDAGDRDWVGFLAYLVAAIRLHLPNFGGGTTSLLRETATSAPPREVVVDTFVRELGELASDATALVFDDFHLVDDSPDVRYVVRELLARGPERLTLVFASRREPPLRLARLRALGEVAALGTDDLRFDADETERLFRETYEMRLEPSLVAELTRRTEGWAASLQLVRTAIHDRDPTQVRAFISSLSGAEGHLYDYLAEEVVGDLDPELQAFLMRSSLLETVDLPLGTVAAGVAEADAARWIDEGERLGLLGKGGPNTRHVARAHPLVRDFLQARLERAIGVDQVRDIHHRIAAAAERIDWQTAARHHLAAGDADSAERVLTGAVESILATGAYAAAEALASGLPSGELPGSAGLVIRSRLAQQRASTDEGLELAERAWSSDPTSTAALLNLVTARSLAGDVVGALDAGRKLERSGRTGLAEIGRVYRRTLETSVEGSVEDAERDVQSLAASLRSRQQPHFLGVALLNQSHLLNAMGEYARALASAEEAIARLASTSGGVELISARLARATSLAYLARIDEARREAAVATKSAPLGQAIELAIEIGQFEALVGESELGMPLLDQVRDKIRPDTDTGEQALLTRILLATRAGDLDQAMRDASRFSHGAPRSTVAFEARRLIVKALVGHFTGAPSPESVRLAIGLASAQGARLWHRVAVLLQSLGQMQRDPSEDVRLAAEADATVLSILAEVALQRMPDLDGLASAAVRAEAERMPWRWRGPARQLLTSGSIEQRLAAGRLLELIGVPGDIGVLRAASRAIPDPRAAALGIALSRRLAAPVVIEDLGRLRVTVGERIVDGSDVRRKVLALLSYLVTRPRFAATREEVVESLWPDQDPASALNSLNQTVYFLRRVIEPSYREDLSPGYVMQDSEMVWMDVELVSARSRRCFDLVESIGAGTRPDAVIALANEYRGRFALDFAYEDWTSAYRDSLHSAYLRVVELAVRDDIDGGRFARGIYLAERATEVDPDAEEIHLALVHLYRLSGAHAAAAEKYGQYSAVMKGLGLDPVPLSEIR